MHTKFTSSMMILEGCHATSFPTVRTQCPSCRSRWWPFIFQQDSASSHMNQQWLSENFLDLANPSILDSIWILRTIIFWTSERKIRTIPKINWRTPLRKWLSTLTITTGYRNAIASEVYRGHSFSWQWIYLITFFYFFLNWHTFYRLFIQFKTDSILKWFCNCTVLIKYQKLCSSINSQVQYMNINLNCKKN